MEPPKELNPEIGESDKVPQVAQKGGLKNFTSQVSIQLGKQFPTNSPLPVWALIFVFLVLGASFWIAFAANNNFPKPLSRSTLVSLTCS